MPTNGDRVEGDGPTHASDAAVPVEGLTSMFSQSMAFEEQQDQAAPLPVTGFNSRDELELGSCNMKVVTGDSFAVAMGTSKESEEGSKEGCCNSNECLEPSPSLLISAASAFDNASVLSSSCNAITAAALGVPPCGVKAVCGKRAKMEDAFSVLTCFFDLPASATDDIINKLPARIASQVGEQLEVSHTSSSNTLPRPLPLHVSTSHPQPEIQDAQGSNMSESSDTSDQGGDTLHFYGVYDGHGGTEAAQHCANRLHHHLSEVLAAVGPACMQQQSNTSCTAKPEGGLQCQAEWRLTRKEDKRKEEQGFSNQESIANGNGSCQSEGGHSVHTEDEGGQGNSHNTGALPAPQLRQGNQEQQQQPEHGVGGGGQQPNGSTLQAQQQHDAPQHQQLQMHDRQSSSFMPQEPQQSEQPQQHGSSSSFSFTPQQHQHRQHNLQEGQCSKPAAQPACSYAAAAAAGSADQQDSDRGSEQATEMPSDPPSTVSDFCSSGCDASSDPSDMEAARNPSSTSCITIALEEALKEAFLRTDAEFAADGSAAMVGSTAVVALVGSKKAWVANCGDSRAVLCRGSKAIQLTDDHKPEREDEAERVERAGGQVLYWNGHRVMGVLAMSRAIGDHSLRPYVIPEPEVTVFTRAEDDEFLLLASDGLWDVMSNQEAISLAMRCSARAWEKGASRKAAVRIAASVLTKAAVDRGSKDNVTVVIIDLANNGREDRNNNSNSYNAASTAGAAGAPPSALDSTPTNNSCCSHGSEVLDLK